MKLLRRYFLTGLVVLLPTAITVFLVWWGFNRIDNLVEPLQKRYPIIDIPGLGFIVIILLILITGLLASNLIGRRMIALGEALMNRVPLVRRIYSAIKEVAEVILTDKSTSFQRVVMIRYPHRDAYALAFVTREDAAYFDERVGTQLVSVFIPTTPNPTSGFFLMLPRHDVIDIDVSVENAMKMVISGGAYTPPTVGRPVSPTSTR